MEQKIVKRLDHIIVRTADPSRLYHLFTQTLGLPVAWPMKGNPFFSSAGIHLGNVNLEILSIERTRKVERSWLYGLVFELEPHQLALPELKQRDIAHTPPQPFVQPDEQGWLTTTWNNVYMDGFFDHHPLKPFFFKLSHLIPRAVWERGSYPTWFNLHVGLPLIFDWVYRDTAIYSVEYNPTWHRENIETDPGFPGLELVEVSEIQLSARQPEQAAQHWRRFLAPISEVEPLLWSLPDGPCLRIVPGENDGLGAMIWRVRSLNRAAQFLHQHGMLQHRTESETTSDIAIAPSSIHGLDIRLKV